MRHSVYMDNNEKINYDNLLNIVRQISRELSETGHIFIKNNDELELMIFETLEQINEDEK